MKRIELAIVVLTGAVAALSAGPARAQNVIEGAQPAARTLYVFNAGAPPQAKLGTWGNGQADLARDRTYLNDPVLKIRSRNFYEGARFDLSEPIDLTPYKKDGFIRLRLRFADQGRQSRGGGGGGGRRGGRGGALPPGFSPDGGDTPGGAPGGGFSGGGARGGDAPDGGPPGDDAPGDDAPDGGDAGQGRGGMPRVNQLVTTEHNAQFGTLPAPRAPRKGGAGMPPLGGPGDLAGGGGMFGGGGRGGAAAGPPPQKTTITRLRVAFIHDQGVTVGSVPVDLTAMTQDDEGWRVLFFPLRDMRATTDVSGPVKRVILSSDNDDTFWLAQLALVIENPKMRVSIRRPSDEVGAQIADITVKPGPLSLVADVESGIADPIIEWNFDADVVGNLPPAALSQPVAEAPVADAGGDVTAPAVVAGPRIDARGLQARFEYPNEEQNYRVEVTVRDRSGKKTPVKASILVRVRG